MHASLIMFFNTSIIFINSNTYRDAKARENAAMGEHVNVRNKATLLGKKRSDNLKQVCSSWQEFQNPDQFFPFFQKLKKAYYIKLTMPEAE